VSALARFHTAIWIARSGVRPAALRCMLAVLLGLLITTTAAFAQSAQVAGQVRDETGGVLPGVTVELRGSAPSPLLTVTDSHGTYRFDRITAGHYTATFSLINFAGARRDIDVTPNGISKVDAVLHLTLNAEVTVTGTRTFANLADVENPAENLVGIAQSASQGAITARQLDQRPLMRGGEVLEAVPGVIVTQHSGEGKANQYFLRGFNLDHGTDFASFVADMPVNMPSHAHGQGYSDLNFLIPELVSGVQFSKGPYYAEQGDFATAGSSNIRYANALEVPIVHVEVGGESYSRVLLARSPQVGPGHLVAALELAHNHGPWEYPDQYQKINAALRYSQGNAVNGFSLTALGYHGRWNSTDQVPQRAVTAGLIGRFGAVDPTDGGSSYRYSLSADWQRGSSSGNASTRITAYGIAYDLNLFSIFTYYLDDPAHGDQIEQADHRFITGVRAAHHRRTRWKDHLVQNTFGLQVRHDDIGNIGLYHTQARVRLGTGTQDAVIETTGGVYAQNEIEWAPWFRTTAGLRTDLARFHVDAFDIANSGTAAAGLVSPKGGVIIGPWKGTEVYGNAGTGFHSNDARGTTITRDAQGSPADRVTPLVRAKGAEIGVRTVAVPHLQSTLSVWMLRLDSELVFSGDTGTTDASKPSARHGVEWANYYRPINWLTFDGDLSWSRAEFRDVVPISYVPEAVGTVLSAGVTIDGIHHAFGSVRWRYFGPRTLVEDNSVRSKSTSLVNLQSGYQVAKNIKVALNVFNLLNSVDSDIDYYYTSRLPDEPLAGFADIHTHPTLPRTARLNLIVSF
jgi:outer membrane receptor protein involved in Fe transport